MKESYAIFLCKQTDGRTAPVSRVMELDAPLSLKPSIVAATPCERATLQVSSLGSSPPCSSTIYRIRGLCRTRWIASWFALSSDFDVLSGDPII
ncbi:hypothetical protein GW17_00027114 [Ensete ventricosum]|nr:hypothetical protein GW17_00027114 [Ensete ventricosum]